MCSDRVSNSGALALESETLLTAPCGPAINFVELEFSGARIKVLRQLPHWLWKGRVFRFYYTWTWGHLGHVTYTKYVIYVILYDSILFICFLFICFLYRLHIFLSFFSLFLLHKIIGTCCKK